MNNTDFLNKCEELLYDYIDPFEVPGALEAIKEALTAIERKGKWEYPTDIIGFGRCGNCKALWDIELIHNKYFRYCPRCGAKMERSADDET